MTRDAYTADPSVQKELVTEIERTASSLTDNTAAQALTTSIALINQVAELPAIAARAVDVFPAETPSTMRARKTRGSVLVAIARPRLALSWGARKGWRSPACGRCRPGCSRATRAGRGAPMPRRWRRFQPSA